LYFSQFGQSIGTFQSVFIDLGVEIFFNTLLFFDGEPDLVEVEAVVLFVRIVGVAGVSGSGSADSSKKIPRICLTRTESRRQIL